MPRDKKASEPLSALELLERDLVVEGRPAQQLIDFLAEGACANITSSDCYSKMAESVVLDNPLHT